MKTIKIERDDAMKFNKIICDTNPLHDEREVVPGMLLYGIAAHFFDSRYHAAEFRSMVKYGDEITLQVNNGVRFLKNGKEVFNLHNGQSIECDNDMKYAGETNIDVLKFFNDYFKKNRLGSVNALDNRISVVPVAVGALAKKFYEKNSGFLILRNMEFEFLNEPSSDKRYKIYKHEEISGRSETIYVRVGKDNPVAIGKIDVVRLENRKN